MTPNDYTMELAQEYEPFDHVCQYRESNWEFLARWMEREGMYFHFEHGESQEKVVIRDSRQYQRPLGDGVVRFYDTGGGDVTHVNALRSFRRRRRTVPSRVVVANYDYLRPSMPVEANEKVEAQGGETRIRGQYARSPAHAKRLSRVRSDELKTRATVFEGEGPVLDVRAGYTFTLEDHPIQALDTTYLATRVEHIGRSLGPEAIAVRGLLDTFDDEDGRKDVYRVNVSAILAETQFRAEQRTPWPRVDGMEGGSIDGPVESEYAQIDEHGRYLVKMRFDEGKQGAGAASTRIRMLQPYGGNPEGFHFPLRKGTEVLVVFLGGDPDRPVIAGAVPNAHTPSVVTQRNNTRNVIHTSGGNRIQIEDLAGKQHVRLWSPHLNSYTHIGAPNDSHNHISFTLGNSLSATGIDTETNAGGTRLTVIGGFLFKAPASDEPFTQGAHAFTNVITTTFTDANGNVVGILVVTEQADANGNPILDSSGNPIVLSTQSEGFTARPTPPGITATTSTKKANPAAIGSLSSAAVSLTAPADPLLNEAWRVSSLNANPTPGTISNNDVVTGGDLNLIGITDPVPRTYRTGSDIKYVMGDNVTKVANDSLSVVQGGAWSHVYKDSFSHVEGTVHGQIDGDSHGHVNGNQTSEVDGNVNSFIGAGRQTEVMLNDASVVFGAKESLVTHGNASVTLVEHLGLVVGMQQSIVLGERFTFTLGDVTTTAIGNTTVNRTGNLTNNIIGNTMTNYLGPHTEAFDAVTTRQHQVKLENTITRIANEQIAVHEIQTFMHRLSVMLQQAESAIFSHGLTIFPPGG